MCEGQSKVLSLGFPLDFFDTLRYCTQEVEQGFITFEGEDPAHIEEMLMFLYTMRYPQKPFRDGTASDMVLDAYMYAIADRYGLPKLQTEARRAFEARLPLHYTDPTFMEAVKVAYDSTPQTDRGLRDMIMGVVWGNRSVMLVKEHVQECVMGSEGLKHDLLMELFATPGVVGYKKKERAKKITV